MMQPRTRQTAATEGCVIIPGSRRPDGSLRKDIRVRAGYVPQEEVPIYQVRGRRLANRENASPSSSTDRQRTFVEDTPSPPPAAAKPLTPTQIKNEKRKVKRKEQQSTASGRDGKETTKDHGDGESNVEAEKKLKAVKKKLKQIAELEAKLATGTTTENADQTAKLSRKKELEEELSRLELQLGSLSISE